MPFHKNDKYRIAQRKRRERERISKLQNLEERESGCGGENQTEGTTTERENKLIQIFIWISESRDSESKLALIQYYIITRFTLPSPARSTWILRNISLNKLFHLSQ